MTELLEEAFARAAALSPPEQDVLACRLLAELADEDDFDRAIADSSDKLASLAREAFEEHRAGLTEELDADRGGSLANTALGGSGHENSSAISSSRPRS
jgi:hypothetical protein